MLPVGTETDFVVSMGSPSDVFTSRAFRCSIIGEYTPPAGPTDVCCYTAVTKAKIGLIKKNSSSFFDLVYG